MKTTNIALHAVLAAISIASHASAQGYIRGSVEEREEVRRETMGYEVTGFVLDACAKPGKSSCDPEETCRGLIDARMKEVFGAQAALPASKDGLYKVQGNAEYMRACSDVAALNDECLGCQGYELEGDMAKDATKGIVHIPGCVNMKLGDCWDLVRSVVETINDKHQGWFPKGTTYNDLEHDQRQIASTHDMVYYNLALPIKGGATGAVTGLEAKMTQEVAGLAGDCMVYYPWTWCLEVNTGNTQCTKLAPFDCSLGENGGLPKEKGGKGCLTAENCCKRIQGEGEEFARYMYPDINGNRLQCYAWGIDEPENAGPSPGPGPSPSPGPGPGPKPTPEGKPLRLIIHMNRSRVAYPAMITAMDDFNVRADRGIANIFREDNLNKWEDKYNQAAFVESMEMVTMNDEVVKQTAATQVAKESGYKGNTNWSEVKKNA